jgi:hypothetical protein
LAMKCAICGAENPEGQRFCGICGSVIPVPPPVQPMQPTPIQEKQSWLESNLTALIAVVIVVIVALASVGLIYTQPWSKIKVLVYNQSPDSEIVVAVFIDGRMMAIQSFPIHSVLVAGGGIVGVWPVDVGTHQVAVDGAYGNHPSLLDGNYDWCYVFEVGPLYTKNVYIYLGAE